mmetsp:Transcript_7816/g.11595  ORF Transcript_7816/g.11595 Transcript_7816/m.11595 type:complete len:379 (+) Transcript_7816:195-1331(+)
MGQKNSKMEQEIEEQSKENKDKSIATIMLQNKNNMIYSKNGDSKKVTKEDFQLLKTLGKGNFAKVLLVKKIDTGNIFAMKILDKSYVHKHNEEEHIRTERIVLQFIKHPFLIDLIFAFQTKEKLYMIMEYVSGGELFSHLKKCKRFDAERARFYAAELYLAIEHLHKNKVVYRDLKPENILLRADGHICLTDFGLAKILPTALDRTHTFCGTPEYLAPEIILNKGHGKEVDWWSFGTLIYEMLVGIPPFYSDDIQEMYDNILHADLIIPDIIDDTTADFLTRLLSRDPQKRLGTKSGDDIKNHPYFESINWENMYEKKEKVPFVPTIEGQEDVKWFDKEFTAMPASDSLIDGSLAESMQDAFKGFTFTGDSKPSSIIE